MRRLVIYLGATLLTVAALALMNRLVDPFGEFYDRGAVAYALDHDCLVSNRIVGERSDLDFKQQLVRASNPRTIVLGTSRVLNLPAAGARTSFVNAGMPGTSPGELGHLMRSLAPAHGRPFTIYLGIEFFWFDRAWAGTHLETDGPIDKLRYLTARETLSASATRLLHHPGQALGDWRRRRTANGCLVDGPSGLGRMRFGWTTDGRVVPRWKVLGKAKPTPPDEYGRDLVRFASPYYRHWSRLDPARLRALEQALAQARRRGWRVVGFFPPYSRRWSHGLETGSHTSARIRELIDVMPGMFRRNGFPFLDLHRVAAVPCGDDAFEDDGWHPDARCGLSIRRRLDRAAAQTGGSP